MALYIISRFQKLLLLACMADVKYPLSPKFFARESISFPECVKKTAPRLSGYMSFQSETRIRSFSLPGLMIELIEVITVVDKIIQKRSYFLTVHVVINDKILQRLKRDNN